MTPTAQSLQGFRNRIINGDMRIDQRNNGASVSISNNTFTYTLDRWGVIESSAAVLSVQRLTDSPAGFTDSLGVTVTTADTSLASTEYGYIEQRIEGFNVSDLSFGSAQASTVTLSFWVKSNVVSTAHCVVLLNSASNRCYATNFAVSTSGAWSQVSVTIPGDTAGTWLADNGTGLVVRFGLGTGTTRRGTADTWVTTSDVVGTSSPTPANIMGAVNNYIYITGVQLEAGSVATPFERRPYGTELSLCQRYYYKTTIGRQGTGFAKTTTVAEVYVPFQVNMRVAPTALEQSGTASDYLLVYQNTAQACSAVPTFGTGAITNGAVNFTVSSGLTAGNGLSAGSNSASSYLAWSAEL